MIDGVYGETDGHLIWAAQLRPDGSPAPGVRVYRHGLATAVASPGLSGRDRIAVAGEEADALILVRDVLREVGPTYRPFGEAGLIDGLVRGIPQLGHGGGPFLWMETTVPHAAAGPERVGWLDAPGERAAGDLFARHFPDSYAQPGRPGVRRWAGLRDEADGRLLAVAADAWSAGGCGFLAGVVTHPGARGRGLGGEVSAFVVGELVRDHGRAALMVDAGNVGAVGVYERVGMRGRVFGAAGVD
ncbi:GNAT family N-acetyltransferase [Streptomyces pseudovenezuelae]|uniref:GNAT superfamily N-acetyltransferase n=1 Tax=Streptomyces pseudovenezuelae TaxID=67350 RepID=A0ABT6LNE2_9ACTN|nr:GNAT family N-acetyltransferase [Streptomyces pseudovenezuelae]MDH6217824.1 GNAT superfamily N-acetyltransferase [Streptomyces pseudovenezuelae]